jgi:hypothetical protein
MVSDYSFAQDHGTKIKPADELSAGFFRFRSTAFFCPQAERLIQYVTAIE